MSTKCLTLVAATLACSIATAGPSNVEQYFEEIRSNSAELRVFLTRFPKGGDLHNHLDGSVYAETYIAWAAEDGKCVQLESLSLSLPPCDVENGAPPVADVIGDVGIVNRLIDSLSVRNYEHHSVSGHDHFFGTFGRFYAATRGREADMLVDTIVRASRQNIPYLELMQIFGMQQAIAIGAEHERFADLNDLEPLLNSPELEQLAVETIEKTDSVERELQRLLPCDSQSATAGCDVHIRYLATVLRSFSRQEVAAQTLLAFKLVARDPRYVGLNFVMPEDWPITLSDYTWQMELIRKLGQELPTVTSGISLHAGELTMGLVPPGDLQFHVNEAVNIAGARRIGHATSIAYEHDVNELLQTMSRSGVLVEVNLTSNLIILGVSGSAHPFDLVRRNNVPVALSTDNEGVERIDLTHEYQVAVETYEISYAQLKELSRNSLAYSFLPGASLFENVKTGFVVPACRRETLGTDRPDASCIAFLAGNKKAELQWALEKRFGIFEATYMQ